MAGQPASRKRPAAYEPPSNATMGSVLPCTMASGTARWAALSFSSAYAEGSHWKITPAEIGNAPAMASGLFIKML